MSAVSSGRLQPQLKFLGVDEAATAVPNPWRERPMSKGDNSVRHLAYWDWQAQKSHVHTQHAVVCVHGLTRQGRDFDEIARHLTQHVRVICPDVAGRGHSDWLRDPTMYQLTTYAKDLQALLQHLKEQGIESIDWIGTSMGGLIGMALASQSVIPFRRLVLNDVGPTLQLSALSRISQYLGVGGPWSDADQAVAYLRSISLGFGEHSAEQWRALSMPMLRLHMHEWHLHYDPLIAEPLRIWSQPEQAEPAAQAGEVMLWNLYDAIRCPTLLLRGSESDLLLPETAEQMSLRGPRALCREVPQVGHAPMLVQPLQIDWVSDFLFVDQFENL